MSNGTIRVGIGGWTYEPWRGGVFYPQGLAQKRELEHAASVMTAIEINGTYYSSFKPASFETWAKAVPDDFVFTAKASRYVTNRKVLAEAGESIDRFLGQGITALGDKLGPILWQFMATKKFDADDFGAFLDLLPAARDGVKLRHAVHVRHESFRDPAFVAMARAAGVAIVNAWSDDYPGLGDVSGDFIYARFENAVADEPRGFPAATLDRFAGWAKNWAAGKPAGDLPVAGEPAEPKPRDVFAFMINGAKERAPAAAQALIERVGHS
ncbi:DUF72 domain-containing protein [uncultured Sphingomonas sp.]|uniref:DUF72 domain-containing protein n=1 Tax=uncultured Sphingomonas sp. TaxID=158754 RepID=UPI0025FD4324|nr:DUF72 domain-containing protein [uncultured Sphingomonas sp.]